MTFKEIGVGREVEVGDVERFKMGVGWVWGKMEGLNPTYCGVGESVRGGRDQLVNGFEGGGRGVFSVGKRSGGMTIIGFEVWMRRWFVVGV